MDWCAQYIQCVFPVQGGTYLPARETHLFMVVLLYLCFVAHCTLSEVGYIYTTFRCLAVLPS